MKTLTKISSIASAGYLLLSVPQLAYAADDNLNISAPVVNSNLGPQGLITFVINAFFFVAIVAALVYLLWGGLNWILSGGDKDKIEAARSRIVAAIIGLVLVVLAYFILDFVLHLLGLCGIQHIVIPTLSGATLQGCGS